jgi:hypothetical protein
MKTPLRLILFLTALLIMHTAAAQTIRASFIPQLNPFSYVDSDGSPSGFYIELSGRPRLVTSASMLELCGRAAGAKTSPGAATGNRWTSSSAVAYTAGTPGGFSRLSSTNPWLSAYTQVVRRRRGAGIESVLDLDARQGGHHAPATATAGGIRRVREADSSLDHRGHRRLPRTTPPLRSAHLSPARSRPGPSSTCINLDGLSGRRPHQYRLQRLFATSFATAKGTNAELTGRRSTTSILVRWKGGSLNSPYYEIFSAIISAAAAAGSLMPPGAGSRRRSSCCCLHHRRAGSSSGSSPAEPPARPTLELAQWNSHPGTARRTARSRELGGVPPANCWKRKRWRRWATWSPASPTRSTRPSAWPSPLRQLYLSDHVSDPAAGNTAPTSSASEALSRNSWRTARNSAD